MALPEKFQKFRNSILFQISITLTGIAFIVAVISLTAIYLIQSKMVEENEIELGYSYLSTFVELSRHSISKGQKQTFQAVIDDLAKIEEVQETAVYSRSKFMTYKSGEVTVGIPFSYEKKDGQVVFRNPNRKIYEESRGRYIRDDWNIKDLVQTDNAQEHIRQNEDFSCDSCHYMIGDKIQFDENNQAHDFSGDKRDFYYRIPMDKECVSCHTNWKEDEAAGYLKVSLDPSLGNEQRRNIIIGVLVVMAVVTFPTVVAMLVYLWLYALRPLRNMVAMFKTMAEGDLTKRIDVIRNDEVGVLGSTFNSFIGQLGDTIRNISKNANRIDQENVELNKQVHEISNTIHGLSELMMSESAAIEQTSASMFEIQSGVEMTSKAAREANQLAQEADQASQESSKAVQQLHHSMEGIQDTAHQLNTFIAAINDIANQTNLLSLNATIESAKAGEQGKGFAVVANEVRRLAENSAKVTQKMQGVIQESITRADEGQKAVRMVDTSLSHISDKISKNLVHISQISTATSEQTISLQEIGTTLTRLAESSNEVADGADKIDKTTVQQAQLAENTASHAEELTNQIRWFKYTDLWSEQ